MKIWKPGTDGTEDEDLLLEVAVDDDSYRYRELMGEHYLLLKFALSEHVEIPRGAWCEFEGETYTLEDPSKVTVVHRREYEYEAAFDSPFVRAARVVCRDTASGRLKFPLTAKPVEHLQLIVRNLNRNSPGWTVGDCLDVPEKVVQYNHSNCADALSSVAEAFETEYEVVRKVLSLKKVEYNKDSPLPLSYGKGNGLKSGISRSNDDSFPVTTLFVQGGTRNIDMSSYGSDELLLPSSEVVRFDGSKFDDEEGFDLRSSRIYGVSADGRSVVCLSDSASPAAPGNEAGIDLSDIYPKRVGSVTSVVVVDQEGHLYDIVDNTIPSTLDYEECLIEGETMTVVFQTGMLAGREFEAKYFHDAVSGRQARRFELVPAEMDGYTMPGGNYVPEVGDEYAVFGTTLPQSYIRDDETRTGASWDMLREAVRSLWEQGSRHYEIKAELDGIWTKSDWANRGGKIRLGGYISFTDPALFEGAVKMRITSVKQRVNNPYGPEIVFSNGLVSASQWHSTVGRIDKAEVVIEENRKEAAQYTKRRFRDAQETIAMLQDSMLGFGESINPAAIETMALLVGDRRLQFRFVESAGNPAPVAHSVVWDKDFSVIRAEAGVIQHLTLGIDSISPSHSADEYTYWSLPEYVSPPLTDGTKKYYLYAKVSKTAGTGEFYLSEDGMAFDGIAGYYHLLVGILNSEYLGERSWVSLYGFTEILPGQISTEMLKDPQGRLVIDLASGTITGPVRFSSGSSGLENLDEWQEKQGQIDSALENAQDAIDAANGVSQDMQDLEDTVNGAFRDGVISEAEAIAISKYINQVNESYADLKATYDGLHSNPYLGLVPGAAQSLKSAMDAVTARKNALLSAISAAISDMRATEEEAAAVDSAFYAYSNAVAGFKDAVETAYEAIQDLLKSYSDSALEKAQEAKDYIDNVLPDEIAAINRKLDGVVENWYYDHSPARSNSPASEWIAAGEEAKHEGDTFTNIQEFVDEETTPDAGKSWRWVKNASGTYDWTPIADSDAVKALLDAARAQDTADGKRRVFVDTPFTPYDKGDLWVQGEDGDIMRCILSRAAGEFDASDWGKASKYTDDTLAEEVMGRLDDWASDGFISPPEKSYLSSLLEDIQAEHREIDRNADELNLKRSSTWQMQYYPAYTNVLTVMAKYTASEPELIPVEEDYDGIGRYFAQKGEMLDLIARTASAALGSARETAEEAAAKLEGFTKIEGGLIFSNILKLMEVDGTETSGLSGITKDGDGGYLPFAWAGGTYKEAQDGDSVVIIWHDGRAKFGVAEIDPYGRFVVRNGSAYSPRDLVTIKRDSVTTVEEIEAGNIDETVENEGYSYSYNSTTPVSSYHDLPNTAVVNDDGTKLQVDTTIRATALTTAGYSGTYSNEVSLLLFKDGAFYRELGTVKATSGDSVLGDKSLSISESMTVPKGTYRLRMGYAISRTTTGGTVALSAEVDASSMRATFTRIYTKTEFGDDGLMVSYNSKNLIRAVMKSSQAEFIVRSGKGYVDIPGVLAAGYVGANRIISDWGPKSSGLSLSKDTTGVYRVTHNFGHTSYQCFVTMRQKGYSYVSSLISNSFLVYTFDEDWQAADKSFNFLIVGDNKEV